MGGYLLSVMHLRKRKQRIGFVSAIAATLVQLLEALSSEATLKAAVVCIKSNWFADRRNIKLMLPIDFIIFGTESSEDANLSRNHHIATTAAEAFQFVLSGTITITLHLGR